MGINRNIRYARGFYEPVVSGGSFKSSEEAAKVRDAMEQARDGAKGKEPIVTAEPEPGGMAVSAEVAEQMVNGSDMWAAFEQVQKVYTGLDTEKDEAEVTLQDKDPVLLVWSADWHIGHQYCDMVRLRHDLQVLGRTPGVYAFLGGDLHDNVVIKAHAGMHFENLAPKRIQMQLNEQALQWVNQHRTGNVVLAMVGGNHEAWSIASDDFDATSYFSHKLGCINFGPWGLLHVKLGEQQYRVLGAHQFRMHSSFNKTHSAKRLMDAIGDADAVFTAHRHDPAGETAEVRRLARFFAQAGTYLLKSRFGKGLGFTGGVASMPGVVLFPGERKVMGVYDAFRDGIHILSSYRQDMQCSCQWCGGAALERAA